MCDEIIELYKEEINFNENRQPSNITFLQFTSILINIYSITDICQYLLLSDKISRKTKKIIIISLQKQQIKRNYSKVKDIDIKTRTYYFFDDVINIKSFDPNHIKIDEKVIQKYSYLLYWIYDENMEKPIV